MPARGLHPLLLPALLCYRAVCFRPAQCAAFVLLLLLLLLCRRVALSNLPTTHVHSMSAAVSNKVSTMALLDSYDLYSKLDKYGKYVPKYK